jgi:hypothetical protein
MFWLDHQNQNLKAIAHTSNSKIIIITATALYLNLPLVTCDSKYSVHQQCPNHLVIKTAYIQAHSPRKSNSVA